MAASTEQIALWILAALKEERERDPSRLTCRTEAIVLGPLKSKHKIEDADITRGIKYLMGRRALDAVNRKDGRATLPNEIGLEILAEHLASEKKRTKEEFDRRFRVYAVIVAIIAVAATVVGMLMKR
jgi:hypothetical protein